MRCSTHTIPAVAMLALSTALPAGAQTRGGSALELSLFRTQAANRMTSVDAVAEIDPHVIVGGDNCSYMVRVAISDSSGGEPVEDQWRRTVSCETVARNPGTKLVDTFSFAVRPGHYRVTMTITPASNGQSYSASQPLDGLAPGVRLSDLFLAREVGWDPDKKADWPLRKGGIGLAVESGVDVPRNRPFLAYYLELYRQGEATPMDGVVTGTILRPGGGKITQFTLQKVDSLTVDRPVVGTVSLAGLPIGSYDLEVRVAFPNLPEAVRRARFQLVEQDAAAEAAALARQQTPGEVERYFAQLGDSAVARFDALDVWLNTDRDRTSFQGLSPDAKRRFLTTFFNRASVQLPDGSVLAGPAALSEFVSRLSEVDRLFGERTGETQRDAWRTDRGRLYLRFGKPADRITRPFPGNESKPYEIWYYTIGRGFVYLFVDEAGFGNYRLLYSTEPNIASVPGWANRAGPDAVNELATYYGIR